MRGGNVADAHNVTLYIYYSAERCATPELLCCLWLTGVGSKYTNR